MYSTMYISHSYATICTTRYSLIKQTSTLRECTMASTYHNRSENRIDCGMSIHLMNVTQHVWYMSQITWIFRWISHHCNRWKSTKLSAEHTHWICRLAVKCVAELLPRKSETCGQRVPAFDLLAIYECRTYHEGMMECMIFSTFTLDTSHWRKRTVDVRYALAKGTYVCTYTMLMNTEQFIVVYTLCLTGGLLFPRWFEYCLVLNWKDGGAYQAEMMLSSWFGSLRAVHGDHKWPVATSA